MKQEQIRHKLTVLTVVLLLVLLVGCGAGQVPQQPFWPGDITVSVAEAGRTQNYELSQGSMIYGTSSATYLESAEGDVEEKADAVLSIMGIGIGDPIGKLFSNSNMKAGHAGISCEYKDGETGQRSSLSMIYEGSMIDLNEPEAYNCMVTIMFYFDDGRWQLLELREDNPESHDRVIAVTYDIQGPLGSFGVESGQVCGIICEFY